MFFCLRSVVHHSGGLKWKLERYRHRKSKGLCNCFVCLFKYSHKKCRKHWFTPVWRHYFIIDLTRLFDFKQWYQLKWNENKVYKYLTWTGRIHFPLLETFSTGLRSATFQHHDEVRSLQELQKFRTVFKNIRKHY